MKVGENKVVSMTYILREKDAEGMLIQEVTSDRPFVYLFGMGGLIPAFKANLIGLKKGDDFSFLLGKDDAYGVASEKNVIELPKEIFFVDGKFDEKSIRVGEIVPMEDEDGYPLSGKVLSIEKDTVLVDFNHPLAGMDLYFEGKIVDVRDATEEELAHGHVHGDHDHAH